MTPEHLIPRRYRVLELISSGGLAAVFKVRDEESGRVRALKLLPLAGGSPTEVELLKLEFGRVSSLRHPCIVRVHDFGSVDFRSAYFVMDYLEAEHFDRAMKGRPAELVAAASLQVCEALGYVHARGIVHGDVKPSNVLAEPEQDTPRSDAAGVAVTLTDFGLARLVRERGLAGGTLAYVAPEVIRGLPVDGRADLYSFGAMLYEAVTGVRLFPGASGDGLLRAHLLSKPVAPRHINPSLSPGMQSVLLRLLEKDPDRRYQTSEELAEAIADAAGLPHRATMAAPAAVTLVSPEMVGRQSELEAMRRALASITDDARGGFLVVLGNHGAGKSRLVEWLRFTASTQGLRVGHLRCGEQELHSAVLKLEWSGRLPGTAPTPAEGGVSVSALAGGSPALIGSIYPAGAAHEAPCLVVFEDVHLAPESLLRNLTESVALTRAFPLLIVCTCEPVALDARAEARSLLAQLRANPAVVTVELGPLSRQGVELLVSSMLGSRAAPEALTDWVYSVSRGVPGTAEELVRQLAARGHLKRLGHRFLCELPEETQILASLSVPDALSGQLLGLPVEEMAFLMAACVVGNVFALETVTRLLAGQPGRVAAAAESLIEKGLIRHAGQGRCAFSHAVTAPIVRGLIPVGARTELHGRMAAILEESGEGMNAGVLALHYEESGQQEKAQNAHLSAVADAFGSGRYEAALSQAEAALPQLRASGRPDALRGLLDTAAQAAERAGELSRAIELSEELLRFVERGTEEGVAAALRLGRLYVRLSRYPDAQARFSAALDAATEQGLEPLKAEAMADLSWALFNMLNYEEALRLLEQAESLAAVKESPRLMALVHNRASVVLARLGRLTEAEARVREAVRLADLAGDAGTTVSCLINLGLTLIRMGRPEEAEPAIQSGCLKAEAGGDLTLLATCYHNLGVARRELLKFDEALDSYLKCVELRKRCGDLAGSGRTALNVAALYRLRGEMGPALRYNEESYRLAVEFTPDMDRSVTACNIGEIHGMRGNVADAERYYVEALAMKEKSGDPNGVAYCATGLGYVFLRNGDLGKAAQWAETAVGKATDDSTEKTAARLLLAEVLASAGRVEEASLELGSIEKAHTARLPLYAGLLRRVRGIVEERSGRLADALESYRSSCSVLGGAGDALERARSLFCLGRALVVRSAELHSTDAAGQKADALREACSVLEESSLIFERMEAGLEGLSCLSALAGAYREMLALPGSHASTDDAATLFKAAELVNSALPCSAVLDKIMDLAIEKTGAERGLIALVNQESGEMEKVLSRSLEDDAAEDAFEISRTVVRRVAHGGASLLTADACEDPDLKDVKSVARLEIRSVLCVPLRARGRVVGAIYLDNRSMPGAFGPRQAGFMEGFADLAGVAVENSRLREELERANELLNRENIELRRHVASTFRVDQIVGESPEMRAVFAAIEKVARANSTVLIVGESGTGKELVARAIHSNSPRREGAFVPVDCVTIPKDLIEGELFGIEDRVATGVSKRSGYFEQADGGTIFLDEIGDMSHELQAKLLRVLQEREFRRIGGRHSISVDVRIICATNKNLLEEYACGRFRADLYHRISGIPIEIPPLRQRKGDIPRLVKFFLKKYCDLNDVTDPPRITPELMKVLVEADWEGNVRQLENCVERFVVMCQPGQEVPFSLLPDQLKQKAAGLAVPGRPSSRRLKDVKDELEKRMLVEALVRHNGNRSRAARDLGISEQSVRYKIRQYRLNVRQLCRD
ncbi:MAG: sigma 54-interacting transcriptional regulator [Candidatus Eisenbacteria bacterium]|nr:sigma 54-interacting transcriptional regulator [Candidatus Eisenbacteria bacterium]